MFQILFHLKDYAGAYRETRDAYLKATNELKLATAPHKTARDAYVAAIATYTPSPSTSKLGVKEIQDLLHTFCARSSPSAFHPTFPSRLLSLVQTCSFATAHVILCLLLP